MSDDLRDQIAASAPTESTGDRSCHPGTCLTGCGSGAVGWRWYAAFGWVPVCACAMGGVVPAHLRRYDADLPAAAKPALDAKDARIAELEARVERFKKQRAGWSGISDLRAEANEYEAERDRLRKAADRACALAEAALEAWKPEREYHQDRAARKGYSHDETAAETYGLAIEAVTAILAALDRSEETPDV